jgi:hypothetical protein
MIQKKIKPTKTNPRNKKPTKVKQDKRIRIMEKADQHSYFRALMNPFGTDTAKIPGTAYGKTFSFKRVFATSFNPNASGEAFLCFHPLSYMTNVLQHTPLLIDNSASYSSVTGQGTAVVPVLTNTALGYDPTAVKACRVVAAGIRITFENPSTTLQPKGKIFCMRETEINATYDFTNAATAIQQNEHLLSYVINNKEHRDFKNNNSFALEYCYRPVCDLNILMSSTNSQAALYPGSCADEFTAIFTRFEPTTTIFVELHYIFEVIVEPEGGYRDYPDYNYCSAEPMKYVAGLSTDLDLFLRYVPIGDDHEAHVSSAMNFISRIADKPTAHFPNKTFPSAIINGKTWTTG